MKAKLLKKLRKRGSDQISIYSVIEECGIVVGMSIGFSDEKYANLFDIGDTVEEVMRKAVHIYIEGYIEKNKKAK